jgi:hypothetical protein
VSRLSRQCGILNISQPYRPPRPVTGTALLFLLVNCFPYYVFCVLQAHGTEAVEHAEAHTVTGLRSVHLPMSSPLSSLKRSRSLGAADMAARQQVQAMEPPSIGNFPAEVQSTISKAVEGELWFTDIQQYKFLAFGLWLSGLWHCEVCPVIVWVMALWSVRCDCLGYGTVKCALWLSGLWHCEVCPVIVWVMALWSVRTFP